jgi:glycosyltransferase involved in cell wall biosynthesis
MRPLDDQIDPSLSTTVPRPFGVQRGLKEPARTPLRVGFFYDMDACHGPTGVTRHALSQLERLIHKPGIALHVITGRITHPDGLAYWETLRVQPRRELPLRTREVLRWWRAQSWPSIEWWAGPLDWIYCPAEFFVPTTRARRAVTSHDVLQALRFEPPRKRDLLGRVFGSADVILSVSHFNTDRLLEAFPNCQNRMAYVPNGADDLFFETAADHERDRVRASLDLPNQMPYLLSVANFQPRKNLVRLIRAAVRLRDVAAGDLAIVLIGTGADEEARLLREAAAVAGRRVLIRMPGYRQGHELRAIYAEATALVFPSLCESFGIPAVEAMAQGLPVALADSTALPEIGGAAGWYFDPLDEDSITAILRSLLDDHQERARRASLGRTIAASYRWDVSNDLLVRALAARHDRVH